jgi:hypothetical protein
MACGPKKMHRTAGQQRHSVPTAWLSDQSIRSMPTAGPSAQISFCEFILIYLLVSCILMCLFIYYSQVLIPIVGIRDPREMTTYENYRSRSGGAESYLSVQTLVNK